MYSYPVFKVITEPRHLPPRAPALTPYSLSGSNYARPENGLPNTAMATGFPFLRLPPELRNQVYREVALCAPEVKLFDSQIIPPSLANTCRQIRAEMSGSYELEICLNHHSTIIAHVTNCNFEPLRQWLDLNDAKNNNEASSKRKSVSRPLVICMTLTSTELLESSPYPKLRAGMFFRSIQNFHSEWTDQPCSLMYDRTRAVCRGYGEPPQWFRSRDGRLFRLCRRRSSQLHYNVTCHMHVVWNDHHTMCRAVKSTVNDGFTYLGDFASELLKKLYDDLLGTPGPIRPPRGSTILFAIFVALLRTCKTQNEKKWDPRFCRRLSMREWRIVSYYRSLDVRAFESLRDSASKDATNRYSPLRYYYRFYHKRFLNSPVAMRLAFNDWNPGWEEYGSSLRVSKAAMGLLSGDLIVCSIPW